MWRWTKGVTAVAVVTAMAIPLYAAETSAEARPGTTGRTTVTLVTGDRVHVFGDLDARPLIRVEGRKGIAFYRRVRGRELSIVPSDAAPLVMAGRLDAALFNVTRLIRDGYDDTARKDIPLIVAGSPGRKAATVTGGTTTRPLTALNGAAIIERKDRAASVWASLSQGRSTFAPEVSRVWLDGKVRVTLDRSVPKIGAPNAWRAGYTGKGVTVGVLDTGIDATHHDLDDAVVASKDFTGGGGVQDGNGHGTHVASTITGDDTKYRGVAPDAKLVVGKVLDDQGGGTFSTVIAGMEWVAAQRVQVVNMSLGASIRSDGTDPMSAAVDALTARTGTLFVIAAGNNGADRSVSIPGVATSALTVGATDLDGNVANFSSRGPRTGDGAIKPDLVAPGVDITAARAKGTELGEPVNDLYTKLSGTSMATPHVAGAAALLLQRHPDWKPVQVKAGLMTTARPNQTASVYEQGAGRIDVGRAVTQQVTADQGSVSFDFRSAKDTRQVTFRNAGTAPVKLDLDLQVHGPDGQQDGMFTVSPGMLGIPAGGTATATFTADPGPGPTGRYSGGLTAKNGDEDVLRLPVGAVKEPPLHEIKLTGVDRTGSPAGSTVETLPWVGLTDLKTGEPVETFVSGNGLAARVPTGKYALNAVVPTDSTDYALFSYPVLTVDRNVTITADARQARRTSVRVDSPTAVRSGFDEIGVVETSAGHSTSFGVAASDPATGLSTVPTATVTQRPYTFYHVAALAEPNGPRAYNLQFLTDKRIPRHLDRRVRDAELAAVTSYYHADKPMTGLRATIADIPGTFFGAGYGEYPVRLPGQRTELYTASPELRWKRGLIADEGGQGFINVGAAPPTGKPGEAAYHWSIATPGTVPQGIRKVKNGPMAFVALPFSSAESRDERSAPMTQTISVWRDGKLIGSDSQAVRVVTPSARALYTVRSTAERTASWTDLGTRSVTEWTFPYTPTMEGLEEPPMFAVRTDGRFDLRNQAPAGTRFVLNMRITDSRLITPGELPRFRRPTLEASYDDGSSWHPAKMTVTGENRWTAEVTHPPRPGGHVSLRVHLSDGAGTSLNQTVIRAYGLR